MNDLNGEMATLAGGCFWCLEAVFEQLQGVERVESGYTGGHVPQPQFWNTCLTLRKKGPLARSKKLRARGRSKKSTILTRPTPLKEHPASCRHNNNGHKKHCNKCQALHGTHVLLYLSNLLLATRK